MTNKKKADVISEFTSQATVTEDGSRGFSCQLPEGMQLPLYSLVDSGHPGPLLFALHVGATLKGTGKANLWVLNYPLWSFPHLTGRPYSQKVRWAFSIPLWPHWRLQHHL